MNTKQKLFTFTSIGAVFATAIAFVAITGARNLEQLRADKTPNISFTSENCTPEEPDPINWVIPFTLSTKVSGNNDFSTVDFDASEWYGTHVYGDNNTAKFNTNGFIFTISEYYATITIKVFSEASFDSTESCLVIKNITDSTDEPNGDVYYSVKFKSDGPDEFGYQYYSASVNCQEHYGKVLGLERVDIYYTCTM